MYDKTLIEKVCNLTCTEEDLEISLESIKFDRKSPFRKYYNVETISNAIQKYINNEWSDRMLAYWCNYYNWIICGGFNKHLKEKLNTIEDCIKWIISDDLDGLSFFDATLEAEEDMELDEDEDEYIKLDKDEINRQLDACIKTFRNLDNIFKTSTQWKGFYAKIGPCGEINDDQFVLLVNDNAKQYIIFHSDFIDNGEEDEYLKYMSQEEHVKKVREIEELGYQLIPYGEEYYFDEANDTQSVDELLKEITGECE